MNKTLTAAAVTVVIVELFAFVQAMRPNGFDAQGFGFASIMSCLLTFFVGLILLAFQRTEKMGKGVLLGTGVLLLIGLFVCGTSGY